MTHHGCLNCPPNPPRLNLNDYIHPGFGAVRVTKGTDTVFVDFVGDVERPVMRAENAARKDPDHLWRIVIDGPLRGAVYQRYGHNEWVMVESSPGFA